MSNVNHVVFEYFDGFADEFEKMLQKIRDLEKTIEANKIFHSREIRLLTTKKINLQELYSGPYRIFLDEKPIAFYQSIYYEMIDFEVCFTDNMTEDEVSAITQCIDHVVFSNHNRKLNVYLTCLDIGFEEQFNAGKSINIVDYYEQLTGCIYSYFEKLVDGKKISGISIEKIMYPSYASDEESSQADSL